MDPKKPPQRRIGRRKTWPALICTGLVLAIALLAGLYYNQSGKPREKAAPVISDPAQDAGNTRANQSSDRNQNPESSEPAITASGTNNASPVSLLEQQSVAGSASGPAIISVPAQPEPVVPTAGLQHCQKRTETIRAFFKHLDDQPYIQTFSLDEPSGVYFPKLIQKLADNPPVVTGETDDLYTVLQNTAHFFRIIGTQNIFILKGILDREKDRFEQVLADFYLSAITGDCLATELGLQISDDALYLYSGFFLNTMGGRLYLFRRDSMSRMIVSYYAIKIIDRANRTGKNKLGIELAVAIDSLITEMESSNVALKLRDEYLDTLYELKVRYQ